jgi:hypothetical protein
MILPGLEGEKKQNAGGMMGMLVMSLGGAAGVARWVS